MDISQCSLLINLCLGLYTAFKEDGWKGGGLREILVASLSHSVPGGATGVPLEQRHINAHAAPHTHKCIHCALSRKAETWRLYRKDQPGSMFQKYNDNSKYQRIALTTEAV